MTAVAGAWDSSGTFTFYAHADNNNRATGTTTLGTPTATGTEVSKGVFSITFDFGQFTKTASANINASYSYNSGWGNARQLCACARSGNRVVAARASSTPDGGAEPLFDQTASINDTHYVIKSNGITLTPGTTFTGPAGRYFREEDISLGGSSTITWTDNS